MKVALYARVSTDQQKKSQTIEQQINRIISYISKESEYDLSEQHIYQDNGVSGANLNRPGLQKMKNDCAMAQFSRVFVTTPDCLARKYIHQVFIIEDFQQFNCEIQFLDRPMDSDNPHDQLLLQIRGAVSEYERSVIIDRMRRGWIAKLQSGQLLPWSRAAYGYILDADRPRNAQGIKIDPVASSIVQQIFSWYTDIKKEDHQVIQLNEYRK